MTCSDTLEMIAQKTLQYLDVAQEKSGTYTKTGTGLANMGVVASVCEGLPPAANATCNLLSLALAANVDSSRDCSLHGNAKETAHGQAGACRQ
eukprot:5414375-Pyramimonas_sp.AAC.1